MRFLSLNLLISLLVSTTSSTVSLKFVGNKFVNRHHKFIKHYCRKMSTELPNNENGWRTILSPSQFKVLRQKATEPPGYSEGTSGELEYELKKKFNTKYPKEGMYSCVACKTPLYTAISKFDSGCGWPAFYEGFPGAIKELPDADGRRIEIVCNNCGSHLGHVFKGEGFPTPTNERHCVNGICLKYEPADKKS